MVTPQVDTVDTVQGAKCHLVKRAPEGIRTEIQRFKERFRRWQNRGK